MDLRIGVVVVHYGDVDLTLRCLRSLVEDDVAPARRVVVVDNGPGSGAGERIGRELPSVEVVVPGGNSGFAAGCNAGIAALGSEVDGIALLNNDAVAHPGWLAPLSRALASDPRIGAAVPKTRFDGRFHEVTIRSATTWRPGRGDGRSLGWQSGGFTRCGIDVTDRVQLVTGVWEPGRGGTWVGANALVRVPELALCDSLELVVTTPPGAAVQLEIAEPGVPVQTFDASPGTSTVVAELSGTPELVLANVGNERRPDGYGIDRGRFEADRAQHDAARDVPAWCGGAVLLRADYVADVGPFDERLFLYYEDLDLSLRGSARGWRYRYEPAAVVEHRVGSSAAGSDRTGLLKERNRLLVLARHDRLARLLRELARYVLVTLSYARREIVSPLARGSVPSTQLVSMRIRALLASLVWIPRQRRLRSQDRRRESPPWIDC